MPELPVTSVYIHIPFCVRKCAYCDFLSFPSCLDRIDEYVDAVCKEAKMGKKWFGADDKNPLQTIYFGGGTPSLLSPSQVGKILGTLRDVYGISEDCEITLEANPGTIDEEKLSGFKKAGINRLSLGIQSLDDSVLQTLGRIHDSETAKKAILDAKNAGFSNISCDMMLGIPGQIMESVKETLDFFLSNDIPHISLYSLILEEGTPMYARYNGDIEKYISQEEDRAMYHLVTSTLKENGFTHYEISNMARPGFESRHNSMYWRAEPYFAFGVGAHYYIGAERGRHAETLDEYLSAMKDLEPKKEEVLITEEILSEDDSKKEFMMLGFRTRSGVGEKAFKDRFGMPVASAFGAELDKEQKAGLVEFSDGIYRLTEKGVDLANQVFMDYV
ncbi:MAG: radical SAM family heme chaperone HemW [Clostridiales bacterium]|nr:radical SAM family heme chaperone HemW [Clostridiales bacterium]